MVTDSALRESERAEAVRRALEEAAQKQRALRPKVVPCEKTGFDGVQPISTEFRPPLSPCRGRQAALKSVPAAAIACPGIDRWGA